MNLEIRTLISPISNGDGNTLHGYASVFNSLSEPLNDIAGNPFVEVVRPNSFDLSRNIRGLYNHNDGELLATTASGNLKLYQDDRGLKFSLSLPDTQRAADIKELVSRGDLNGMSIGYYVTSSKWGRHGDMPLHEVSGIDLLEVSVVPFPAFPKTSVNLRSCLLNSEPITLNKNRQLLEIMKLYV